MIWSKATTLAVTRLAQIGTGGGGTGTASSVGVTWIWAFADSAPNAMKAHRISPLLRRQASLKRTSSFLDICPPFVNEWLRETTKRPGRAQIRLPRAEGKTAAST